MNFPNKFIDADNVKIISKFFNLADSYRGSIQVDGGDDAHQWEIEFLTTHLDPQDRLELGAFINSLKGRQSTFNLTGFLPFYGVSSYSVNGAHTKGVSQLAVTATETPAVGNFVSIGVLDKVYQVSAATATTINITPPLQDDLAGGEVIGEAVFVVRMSGDTNEIELDGKNYQKKKLLSMVENV